MSRRALLIAALIGCAGCQSERLVTPPPLPPEPSYEAIDLGSLGGNGTAPVALNDNGQVVGYSTTAAGEQHAFLWENGVMRDLAPTLAGSNAQTITNSGVIAGFGRQTDGGFHIFRWDHGATTDLGTVADLGGDEFVAVTGSTGTDIVAWRQSQMDRFTSAIWHNGEKQLLDGLTPFWNPGGEARAAAMNDRGQIVGASLMPGAAVNDVYHAFIWEGGVTRDLGVLTEYSCDYDFYPDFNCGESGAVGINNSGQVIGWSFDAAKSAHGVLWVDGSIRDLGPWEPVTINEVGEIAGNDRDNGFFWRAGTVTPFGSLGGGGTTVADLNDESMVVGTSLTLDLKPHAFVWKLGQGTLKPLEMGGMPGEGSFAVAINARGDIIGYTVGPCQGSNSGDGRCSYWGVPLRAVLWRLKPAAAPSR